MSARGRENIPRYRRMHEPSLQNHTSRERGKKEKEIHHAQHDCLQQYIMQRDTFFASAFSSASSGDVARWPRETVEKLGQTFISNDDLRINFGNNVF